MKRDQPVDAGIIRLAIDREHRALVNPLRVGESDDFEDMTNAVFYELEEIALESLPREEATAAIERAIEFVGGSAWPDWLEDGPEDDAAWRAQVRLWLASQVGAEDLMSLAENTPWPEYRDGLELRQALRAARIELEGLREACLRGAPGGSLFAAVYSGDLAELNRLLEQAGLPYRVEEEASDQSEVIGDQWTRVARSSSRR